MTISQLREEFARQAADAPDPAAVQAEAGRRMVPASRRRAHRALAAVAAAVVVVAGGAAAVATVVPDRSSDVADAATPASVVRVLGAEQKADDVLPPGDKWRGDVDPRSSRLLATTDLGQIWVAVGHEGDICLIGVLPNGGGGMACNPIDAVTERGVSLSVYASARNEPGQSVDAELLPSSVPEASLRDAIAQIRAANSDGSGMAHGYYRDSTPLIVLSSDLAHSVGTITVSRDDGTDFTLHLD